jgi:hypothetical protein
MKNSLARIATVMCSALLAIAVGCASVPMSSDAEDSAAKAFTPRLGKANVYVYRNESIGGALRMRLSLDGRMMGATAPMTYFLFEVDPGEHHLISHAEVNSTLFFNAAAGRNYFVWQEVKLGTLQARTVLQLVPEEQGRAGVRECKRAAPGL